MCISVTPCNQEVLHKNKLLFRGGSGEMNKIIMRPGLYCRPQPPRLQLAQLPGPGDGSVTG